MLKHLFQKRRAKGPFRICGVIHKLEKVPFDGTMVYVRWRIKKSDISNIFKASTGGMTQPNVVRNGAVSWEEPFTFEIGLETTAPSTCTLQFTVTMLRSGVNVDRLGRVSIPLIGQKQSAPYTSHLLRDSSSNAILCTTLTVDPIVFNPLCSPAVLDLAQTTPSPGPKLIDDILDDGYSAPTIKLEGTTKSMPAIPFPSAPLPRIRRPKASRAVSNEDINVIDTLFNNEKDADADE